jgi:REP element-mobilizing transposase RayT
MKWLAQNFTIGICSYSVMANHYHAVLKVLKNQSVNLTDEEVIERWTNVYPSGKTKLQLYLNSSTSELEATESAKELIAQWRERLCSISWFMSALNHGIACRANKEDKCNGHFWEARFKSQALVGDMAILACMGYVELNPIRAGIAKDLNTSAFTSIKERIDALIAADNEVEKGGDEDKKAKYTLFQPEGLLPFGHKDSKDEMCFSLVDFIDMVDWTGRAVRNDKRGFIDNRLPTMVSQLKITKERWLYLAQQFERKFANFAGKREMLYLLAGQLDQTHLKGVG